MPYAPPPPVSSLGRILMSRGATDVHEENKSMEMAVCVLLHRGLCGGSRKLGIGREPLTWCWLFFFLKKSQSLSFISASCWHKYDKANVSRRTRAPWLSLEPPFHNCWPVRWISETKSGRLPKTGMKHLAVLKSVVEAWLMALSFHWQPEKPEWAPLAVQVWTIAGSNGSGSSSSSGFVFSILKGNKIRQKVFQNKGRPGRRVTTKPRQNGRLSLCRDPFCCCCWSSADGCVQDGDAGDQWAELGSREDGKWLCLFICFC